MSEQNGVIKLSIMFVCTGNTCRSPMAECLFKDYLKQKKRSGDFSVSSAGLLANRGDVMSEGADAALRILGVKHNPERKARVFTVRMAMDSDLIVAMSESHAERCGSDNAYSFERIAGYAVPDPYGGSTQEYLECAKIMRNAFDKILLLADRLLEEKRKRLE